MGTDIHLIAETRDDAGLWRIVPGPIIDCWNCNGTGIIPANKHFKPEAVGKPCTWCTKPFWEYTDDDGKTIQEPTRGYVGPGKRQDEWYSDRNYNVFAVLADVRNGVGFAGVDTGDRVHPIAQPRGLPDDLSPEGVEWFNHHGGDHSDSWLLLDEVFDYDWLKHTVHRGVVSREEYAEFKKNGVPSSWCGSVSGGMVRMITNEEMDRLLLVKADPLTSGLSFYTHVEWKLAIADYAEAFLARMDDLKLATLGQPTRIVFNFDS